MLLLYIVVGLALWLLCLLRPLLFFLCRAVEWRVEEGRGVKELRLPLSLENRTGLRLESFFCAEKHQVSPGTAFLLSTIPACTVAHQSLVLAVIFMISSKAVLRGSKL